MGKIICEFCKEEFKPEELITTPVDEGELAELCEDCKSKLEDFEEW